ncbi:hypothetical protein V1511DRAFT_491069 [Dipodascopsis uninucleata]
MELLHYGKEWSTLDLDLLHSYDELLPELAFVPPLLLSSGNQTSPAILSGGQLNGPTISIKTKADDASTSTRQRFHPEPQLEAIALSSNTTANNSPSAHPTTPNYQFPSHPFNVGYNPRTLSYSSVSSVSSSSSAGSYESYDPYSELRHCSVGVVDGSPSLDSGVSSRLSLNTEIRSNVPPDSGLPSSSSSNLSPVMDSSEATPTLDYMGNIDSPLDGSQKRKQGHNRNYRCRHCSLVFPGAPALKAHILTLQDSDISQRPYKCPEITCDWHVIGFHRNNDCSRHYRQVHGVREFVCRWQASRDCRTHRFVTAWLRNRHERTVHASEMQRAGLLTAEDLPRRRRKQR